MKKNRLLWIGILILLASGLKACRSTEVEIPENAALVVMGNVDQEAGWVEESIRAMETTRTESTNSKGDTEVYTGVPIVNFLNLAGVKPEAVSVVFIAEDGTSSGEIPLEEVLSCADCIISFRNNGGFSVVAPALGKDAQIKSVVKIEVK